MVQSSKPPVVSVSQVSFVVESIFKNDKRLANVAVRGEISSFTRHTKTGHLYFTLKDEYNQLAGFMRVANAAKLKFEPKVGDNVVCYGFIRPYTGQSKYQIDAWDISADGEGSEAQALEELKRKLEKEGLFSQKRPLPTRPRCIAVVTSPDGAALQDIIRIIGERYPVVKLVVIPTLVQGVNAPASIAESMEKAQNVGADVIIVGRGGGSAEDLSVFNSEIVVRAVYGSAIPTISAVGHEVDTSLCDFAADRFVPTPTAAAQLAVPDKADILAGLDRTLEQVSAAAKRSLAMKERELLSREELIRARSPQNRIREWEQRLTSLRDAISLKMHTRLDNAERSAARAAEVLSALNPLEVLARGFSVAYSNGRVVSDAEQLSKGESVEIRLSRGSFTADVTDIKKG